MDTEENLNPLPPPEKMCELKTVAGVDVGRRNLAIAILQGPPVGQGAATIHSVHLLDVSGASMAGTCHRTLARILPMTSRQIDAWVIEQQPFSNASMYCMAHMLYAILLTHYRGQCQASTPDIRMQSPQRRFTLLPATVLTKEEYVTESKTYGRRKRLATAVVRRLFDSDMLRWAEGTDHAEARAALAGESAIKSDDIADAILHALVAL